MDSGCGRLKGSVCVCMFMVILCFLLIFEGELVAYLSCLQAQKKVNIKDSMTDKGKKEDGLWSCEGQAGLAQEN